MVLLPFEFPLPEGAKSRMVPLPGRTGACLCGCCAGTFDCKSPSRDDSQNDDQDDDGNGPIIALFRAGIT